MGSTWNVPLGTTHLRQPQPPVKEESKIEQKELDNIDLEKNNRQVASSL